MRNPKRPIEIKLRTNVKFCLKNHPFLNTFKEIIANFAPPMKQNYLLTLIMCLLLSSSLWAQDARKLVADFDKKGSVKAANRFFDYLDQEQFTDERIQFATNTPTDSLRKEVWYWAGEWFNDTQEYGLARQYALRALPLYLGCSKSV